jgi:hypothetical protein
MNLDFVLWYLKYILNPRRTVVTWYSSLEINRKWRHRSMASTACFLLLILTWRTKIFGSDWSILTSDRSPETFETRIGSLAMVPVTFYSKTREGKTASWVQTNENNNNVPVKSVKEIRKFWSFSMSQNLSFFPYINASKKNKYTNLWDLNGNEIDDLKSGDHFSTDSVLKQHLFFVCSIYYE